MSRVEETFPSALEIRGLSMDNCVSIKTRKKNRLIGVSNGAISGPIEYRATVFMKAVGRSDQTGYEKGTIL